MVKTEQVKIDSKSFMVKEMTLFQLKEFFDMPRDSTIIDRIDKLLSFCVPELLGDTSDYSPSELQPIIDAMLRVNDAFFVQAAALEMGAAAEQIKKIMNGLSIIVFSN